MLCWSCIGKPPFLSGEGGPCGTMSDVDRLVGLLMYQRLSRYPGLQGGVFDRSAGYRSIRPCLKEDGRFANPPDELLAGHLAAGTLLTKPLPASYATVA